ncbi:hypothetical protein V5F77_00015 [Xanthobacter sp. DSM 24535]|uniref:hypothetical protein n=1 Tax=Roseixanthobacter psychrophilus TaxID=3119917 RepID=UPI003728A8B8
MPSFREDRLELAGIASALASLKFEVQLLRYGLALKAGFSPAQPRVPAGNSDGGQWTDAGGSGGLAREPRTVTRVSCSGEHARVDRSTYRADGSLAEQSVAQADGTLIVSRYAAPGDSPQWTDVHRVVLPDGTAGVFLNRGTTQEIYDGDDRLLGQTVWTETGPQPQAIIQPAYVAPVVRAAAATTIELAAALYTWLSSRAALTGEQPVVAFTTREYAPGESPQMMPSYVGALTKEEVEKACRRLSDVQKYADDISSSLNRSNFSTTASYGTAVHWALSDRIKAENNPNFGTEVSFLKTVEEVGARPIRSQEDVIKYGKRGSIRIDVLEHASDQVTCVYDIKAGKRGLSASRSAEISRAVFARYPDTRTIIVTEIRPKK